MKKVFVVLVSAIFLLSLAACGAQDTSVEAKQEGVIYNVSSAEFEAQMSGDYLLLDVRTQGEYDEYHIDDAVLIPVDEIADRWKEVDGHDKVLVYCRSGNRSATAAQILLDAGIKQIYNLEGGINDWKLYKEE